MFRNPITHRPATPPSRGGFQLFVELATLLSIVVALIAFGIDYQDRKQARAVNAATLREIEESQKARREEAIARAWTTLTTPATGNSGKREALEYLAAQDVSLRGIDLSCAKMGGGWDASAKTCATPVYLQGLVLKAPQGAWVDLSGAHLEGANLSMADLAGADLGLAHLEGASLVVARLTGANLAGASLAGADMMGARLAGAHVSLADFSGAGSRSATGLSADAFTDAWAWAETPPIGLPANISVTLCQYRDGVDYFARPNPCIPPD